MNYHHIVVLLLLGIVTIHCGNYTNTTQFWMNKLGQDYMSYQCYSGFQEIDWYYNKGQSAMYYSMWNAYLHDPTKQDPNVPLMIWLQGGPGASSQFGAFTELGPISIKNKQAKSNQWGWNLMGHMVFIDQPLGVGFSHIRDKTKPHITSARIAAEHLLNFLDNFYKTWPALKKSPLVLTGESFAGHYLPAFGSRIVSNQTFLTNTGITLKGVAIGDGWTDPVNQLNYYDSYLYSTGIVARKFKEYANWYQVQALENIAFSAYRNATPYFDFLTNRDQTRYEYWGGMSTFNFRQYGEPDTSFAAVLNESKSQFGVPTDIFYVPGNDDIYNHFQEDISRPYTGEVINLLRKTRVLIYNGQDDFVVNTPGVLAYLNSLNWEDIRYWKRSAKVIWTVHGAVKGWVKIYRNLWFALVNHAGHMVPSDRPEQAFNLIGHFLSNDMNWKG